LGKIELSADFCFWLFRQRNPGSTAAEDRMDNPLQGRPVQAFLLLAHHSCVHAPLYITGPLGARGFGEPPLGSRLTASTGVTCGVTFTFGGLRITEEGQVVNLDYQPIPGLYAAGELVGGIFYFNYPGGTGLTSGSVFGKIAGTSAGKAARG